MIVLVAFACLSVGLVVGLMLAGIFVTNKENAAYLAGRLDEYEDNLRRTV